MSARLSDIWGSDVPDLEPLGVREIFQGMREGTIKAAIVMADGVDHTSRRLGDVDAALGNLETLIVSSVFDNEITAKAGIVFPAAPFTEQTSTVTNLESRVQLVRQASDRRFDEIAGWELFCGLANAMGGTGFEYQDSGAVFDEVCVSAVGYEGLSHDALQQSGVITNGIAETDRPEPNFEISKPDFTPFASNGMYYAPGRVLHQPERETTLSERNYLNVIDRMEVIELHPEDAVKLGVSEGDIVAVKADGGGLIVQGAVSFADYLKGMVRSTTLFAELATYMEECEYPDPSPTVPSLDVRPVTVEVVSEAAEREMVAV